MSLISGCFDTDSPTCSTAAPPEPLLNTITSVEEYVTGCFDTDNPDCPTTTSTTETSVIIPLQLAASSQVSVSTTDAITGSTSSSADAYSSGIVVSSSVPLSSSTISSSSPSSSAISPSSTATSGTSGAPISAGGEPTTTGLDQSAKIGIGLGVPLGVIIIAIAAYVAYHFGRKRAISQQRNVTAEKMNSAVDDTGKAKEGIDTEIMRTGNGLKRGELHEDHVLLYLRELEASPGTRSEELP